MYLGINSVDADLLSDNNVKASTTGRTGQRVIRVYRSLHEESHKRSLVSLKFECFSV